MRRALFVSHNPMFGGPENQALRLLHPLREAGWDTIVLATDEPGTAVNRLRGGGVQVETTSLHRIRAVPSARVQWSTLRGLGPEVRTIRRIASSVGADLVVLAGLENPHAALAASRSGLPVVWQLLGTRTPMAVRWAMGLGVRRFADAIMCTGPSLLAQHPGLDHLADRTFPFFPPVNPGLFAPDPRTRDRVRDELGFTPADVVIGNVANINAQKDHLNFVRAAAMLKARAPSARFLLLGETSDTQSDYAREVFATAQGLGLQIGRDLLHVRPGDRVHHLAQALDLFWMSSGPRSEGVPTAMLEAMALGVPVVSTDVGAIRDVVRIGESGALVGPQNPAALSDASIGLVQDEAFRRRLGRRAREICLSEASLTACVEAHLDAFEYAVGAARPR